VGVPGYFLAEEIVNGVEAKKCSEMIGFAIGVQTYKVCLSR